ncbi:hypothetical protein EMIHUDRAFT_106738 [Emiliania huxleyi CCMP1516]|uniref:ShKT domain-containing protein n=2 Tax=Emiliania huxleyi TaxID=2903 RepID=A0A0D3I6C3_EMIH1|nr:hypothetical protein EMIHUDRAFT_106738 [Emiliania huxleyi CCMP1516]EOD06808.1 hypothetical protein EMIHUDRAFT_106738 [Emiliania huxleyi CCMP1516]|eukprot:XP_005759237.1 hypothetical protein EMIHUDRAFT_106738 [Emiliania huxleyi CCMP1516]
MGTIRLVVLAAAAWHAAAQVKGSASRCRNKELECDSWSKRGECEKNYDFMADRCPVACGYCANAGLLPTPAVFELEYACDGQLKERPQKWDLAWRNEGGGEVFSPEGTARMLPDGCAFRCRDRLPGCAAAAAQGQCTSLPEVLRKQCPASCGVCATEDERRERTSRGAAAGGEEDGGEGGASAEAAAGKARKKKKKKKGKGKMKRREAAGDDKQEL